MTRQHDERRRNAQPPAASLRRRSRATSGFTLIEIILVMGLLGLAGAMVVPYMSGITEFRTEGAVRRIVSDITFAQSDAMSRQEGRRILFANDGSGYRILADPYDPNNDVIYDSSAANASGKYIVDFHSDPRFEGIHVVGVGFDGAWQYITFDALGGPVAPDGTVSAGGRMEVMGPDGSFEIVVSAFTGRISVNRIE